ncbi:hypothetical protein [Absidia glauca]|uniref:Arrestin C-terminal-like domain-containing protein n=1 Tax=Absidia glauca TaxID=4829 RepID=A0A163KC32_ABSGL|nr:hypothetical protein [Absidia glauca]
MNPAGTNTLYADASFIDKYKLSIELDRTNAQDNVYFAGDCIQGKVRIPYAHTLTSTSRLDIHLSCTFRPHDNTINTTDEGRSSTTKLFKVLVSPCLMVAPNNDYVAFSVPIPTDIPSTMKDRTLPGTTTYKIKAIHEMISLPLSLYPKESKDVTILDRINVNDASYQSSLSTAKDLKAVIPKDVTTKNKAVGKWIHSDSSNPVQCRMSIPSTCFVEGHNIPITLHVQHIAPVKQMEGIQIQLERIVNFTTATGERSVDTLTLSDTILPLICDVDDHSAQVNSHITIPTPTAPTLQSSFSPIQISYRLKATVNLDINNLLDETATPSRKRDIAKGMVNSWGKRIGWAVDGSVTGILPDSIVELELPLTIGTIVDNNDSPSLPTTISNDNSQISLRSASSVSLPPCPPKLPARPASISSPSSCPLIQSSFTASPICEKGNWTVAMESGPPPPPPPAPTTLHQTRSITDPYSLIDYNSSATLAHPHHPLQQPSAPKLDEIEDPDIKGGRSKSTPPEKHPLYLGS